MRVYVRNSDFLLGKYQRCGIIINTFWLGLGSFGAPDNNIIDCLWIASVKTPPDNTEKTHHDSHYRKARRELLTLAATGLPMVLTMKASGRQIANSALDCVFRLPSRVRILVNENGDAWVHPTLRINYRANRGGFRIDHIQRFQSDPETVFVASAASSQFRPLACSEPPTGDRIDCGFALYRTNRNIDPMDYFDGAGFGNTSGANGLYVELAAKMAEAGVSSGLPGVSCIFSIIQSL